jgi:hypothetical protein
MLTSLIIGLVVIAVVYWVITMLPLPEPINKIAVVILVLIALVWFLSLFGFGPGIDLR